MKLLFTILFTGLCAIAMAQKATGKQDPAKHMDTLDVACGMCQFELKGKDCALAIRKDGQAYYADGAHIDAYGDAHAKDGFCNAVRKAVVQGDVVNNRYQVTYFKLLPPASVKQ